MSSESIPVLEPYSFIEPIKINFCSPEENKVFIPEPFNVLEGSVIDKFDDSGKEIKKGFVKTIKDFFKSDKEDLANQTYNDPILESIAAIEKK